MKYLSLAFVFALVACGSQEEGPKDWDEIILDLDVDDAVHTIEDTTTVQFEEIVGDTTDKILM